MSSMAGLREFSFKHALTRDVAYASLPRPERRGLHRRAASGCSKSPADARRGGRARLLPPLRGAPYGRTSRVLRRAPELLRRPARWLSAAPRADRARPLERALELAPEDEARAPALSSSDAGGHHGRLADAFDLLDRALSWRELEDASSRRTSSAWSRAGAGSPGLGRGARRGAARSSPSPTGRSRPNTPGCSRDARSSRCCAACRRRPGTRTRQSRSRDVGDVFAEVNAEINGFTARSLEGIAPAADDLRRLARTAVAHGIPDEAYRAAANYIWSAGGFASVDVMEEAVTDMRELLQQGQPGEFYDEYVALSLADIVYVPAGRWDEADAVAAAVRTKRSVASASVQLVGLAVVCGLALRRGRLDAVDELLPAYRAQALASEEPQRILPMIGVALPVQRLQATVRAGGSSPSLHSPCRRTGTSRVCSRRRFLVRSAR